MSLVCLWLVVVISFGTRARAGAQSFNYAPLNTTLTVPFVLDTLSRTPAMLLNPEDSEFIRDPLKSLGSLFFAMRLSRRTGPKNPGAGPLESRAF